MFGFPGAVGRNGLGGASGASTLMGLFGNPADGLFIDLTDNSLIVKDSSTAANNYAGTALSKLTFTRASTATRFNASGLIESVASDVARIDYNPSPLALRGLLIEGARTNLLTYSEDLSNAAWPKTGSSTGASISAKGVNLSLLIEDTSTGTHQVTQAVSFTSGQTYSMSVLSKAKERSRLIIAFGNSAFSGFSIGDFDLVAVTATPSGGTPPVCSIRSIGDGVFLCTITATASITSAANTFVQMLNGSASYTGNGTSGMYFGAVQVEAGTIPSSYIPTAGATVTRAGEVCKIATTLFPATATGPYTIFVKGVWGPNNAADGNRIVYSLHNGTTAESRFLRRDASTGAVNTLNNTGGVNNFSLGSGTATPGAAFKHAARFQNNNANCAQNGTLLGSDDTVCAEPLAPTLLNLGNSLDGNGNFFHGWIQQIAVVPVALTNAQLQAVTA